MHERVTLIGHNAGHDAVRRHRARPDPSPTQPLRQAAPSFSRLRATDRADTRTGSAPARPAGRAESPEVEVRVSARRKKTSEARWVGGRIVVSLPAHLDGENRGRRRSTGWSTVCSRANAGFRADDEALLARAIDLSDRYLVGARPVSVRWVTNQSARWGSCSYYSGEIRVSHRLRVVPRVGSRLGARPRGGAPDLPGPLPRLSSAGRCLPAPRGSGRCSWPVTGWDWRPPSGEPRQAHARVRRARQTGSSARIRPSRRRLSFAPPSVSSICSVRRKKRCRG